MRGEDYTVRKKRQFIDYVDEAGFGIGFAIGSAARQCYQMNRATDLAEKKKHEMGMSWFIEHVCRAHNMDVREVTEIIQRITNKIEADMAAAEDDA